MHDIMYDCDPSRYLALTSVANGGSIELWHYLEYNIFWVCSALSQYVSLGIAEIVRHLRMTESVSIRWPRPHEALCAKKGPDKKVSLTLHLPLHSPVNPSVCTFPQPIVYELLIIGQPRRNFESNTIRLGCMSQLEEIQKELRVRNKRLGS